MYDLSAKELTAKVIEVRGEEKLEAVHVFKAPMTEDWFGYHQGSSQLGLSKGKDVFETSNVAQEKDAQFWFDMILKVEGYSIKGTDIMESVDWKDQVPLPHKLAAVTALMLFWREDVDESGLVTGGGFELDTEEIVMRFIALQNSKRHTLVYYFSSPGQDDYVKHSRISSKMQFARTKQRNVSAIRIPTDIRPYVGLFDKLIKKVEGYEYEGKDVMELEDWRNKVSALHKAEAVRELFTATLEEEGNE